ncbi:MAG: hypothetical protein OZSIB_3265 [Candidatus Ozemobacter sibiricus]|uniref:Uncharacterized protein n=1 Tax=Candidatus Ozemobacter sibiricus TaxID=2268124 RepID=A0A367ZS01_9BACT|nr:MAG: hypothetical protein OZSIB_3265 [Candidatus Ozemobacter sibiricus]
MAGNDLLDDGLSHDPFPCDEFSDYLRGWRYSKPWLWSGQDEISGNEGLIIIYRGHKRTKLSEKRYKLTPLQESWKVVKWCPDPEAPSPHFAVHTHRRIMLSKFR